MSVELAVVREGEEPLAIDEEEAARVCDLVLEHEGVDRECVVSLTVASDDQIQAYNLEWRGQDRPTDVVSLECERPDDPDLPDGIPCELGDVILAPAYIEHQAERFDTTPADETRLLLIHALLHLLGYDHIEDDEAEVMESLEDELLAIATDGRVGAVVTTRHEELRSDGGDGQ